MRVVYGRVEDRIVDDSFLQYTVAVWEPRNGTTHSKHQPETPGLNTHQLQISGHDDIVIPGGQNQHS